MRFTIRTLHSLHEVDAAAWDALVGDDDPFVEHAFLSALEECGAVGERRGWQSRHLGVWEGERLVAALPLYLKDHSYGEFIFDWAWADASIRAGIPYYPKLVSMVPFTPATGRRLLLDPLLEAREILPLLRDSLLQLAEAEEASSVHLLFLNADENSALSEGDANWLPRLTQQFHWHNPGYESFADFTAEFRSALRKQVRKERQRVAESGLRVECRAGSELRDEDWRALSLFYASTCQRKGSPTYLPPSFFRLAASKLAHRAIAFFAYRDEECVAASLNFGKGSVLYGRYWGCLESYDSLHFELCYYLPIEYCIAHRLQRFEAGAQGEHKLRRGLLPSPIHSVHWLGHPGLRDAVARYLDHEREATEFEMQELRKHGPFRRDEAT